MSIESLMSSKEQKTISAENNPLSFFQIANAAIINLQRWSMILSACLLASMVILGTVDVLSFNLFGFPIPIITDVISALLPGAVFLAMARAQYEKAHVQVDLLEKFFSPRVITFTTLLALVLACLLFTGLTIGAWKLAIKSYLIDERAVAVYDFQIWPSKICFAIGASLALLEACRQLIHTLGMIFYQSNKSSTLSQPDRKEPYS